MATAGQTSGYKTSNGKWNVVPGQPEIVLSLNTPLCDIKLKMKHIRSRAFYCRQLVALSIVLDSIHTTEVTVDVLHGN